MIEIMTREQAKTFREQRLLEEQKRLAEQGISSAFEGKFLVTIGDSSCNYYNFKHFITTQIFGMGIDNFVEKTDWDKKEVIEYLATVDQYDDLWKEQVMDYFGGMEGNYRWLVNMQSSKKNTKLGNTSSKKKPAIGLRKLLLNPFNKVLISKLSIGLTHLSQELMTAFLVEVWEQRLITCERSQKTHVKPY